MRDKVCVTVYPIDGTKDIVSNDSIIPREAIEGSFLDVLETDGVMAFA